jgi:hypothetical protein
MRPKYKMVEWRAAVLSRYEMANKADNMKYSISKIIDMTKL